MLAKRQQNYADKARLLTITTVRFGGAGVLGQLIPPNLSFIFYGVLSTESVGLLFMSGVIPGLLMVLILLTYIVVRCSMNPRLGPTLPVVALILLILGVIYTSIATPHRGSWCGGCGSDDLHCHQAKAQLGDPKAGHFFIWFSFLKPPFLIAQFSELLHNRLLIGKCANYNQSFSLYILVIRLAKMILR